MQDTIEAENTDTNWLKVAGLLAWATLPCAAMWMGLYVLSSAFWAFALYHIICLVPALVVGRKLWKAGLKPPSIKICILLLLVALGFSAITVISYELLGHKVLSNQEVIALMNRVGWAKSMLWPLSLYAVIVNPVLEEFYWRGMLLVQLDRIKNPPFPHFGIIVSSLFYALFHYFIFRLVLFPFHAELGSLMLACYGALLAIIYRRTGSILTTAIAHGLLTDLAAVALIADLSLKYPGAI